MQHMWVFCGVITFLSSLLHFYTGWFRRKGQYFWRW